MDRDSGNCWDVSQNGSGDGTVIQSYPCTGGANQNFQVFYPTPNLNIVYIRNVFSGKCVDVHDANIGRGVIEYECNATPAQLFMFNQPRPPQPPSPPARPPLPRHTPSTLHAATTTRRSAFELI